MKPTRIELSVGLFVLAGLVAIGYLALRLGAGQLLGQRTYEIRARFANVGGLAPGAAVRIAGVQIGRVERLDLTPDFAALATLRLRADVRLPADTIASIKSAGLIGDKFIGLAPGAETAELRAGDTITDTESSVDLESLISRFAFGNVTSSAPAPSPAPSNGGAAPMQP
jgi:phospholipid/cholesterol/gamma-HCH transport system substrate-binding protein